MAELIPVILAGGSGTRLWPASRAHLPKQLTALVGEATLIQETYRRLRKRFAQRTIYISVAQAHWAETKKQLPAVPAENYIVEPVGRNTAPALGLIAVRMRALNPKAVVATIPSDHLIEHPDVLLDALEAGAALVEKNPRHYLTIGIKPTEPHTGLGYIQVGREFGRAGDFTAYRVEAFHEKPDARTAERYALSLKYLWNANYLVWQPAQMLRLFARHAPAMSKILEKIAALEPADEAGLRSLYLELPNEPIDTAINEREEGILVIPADLGWHDIGSWATLHEVLARRSGHHVVTRGAHVGLDDENLLVHSQGRLVATIGLKDIIIVETPDVTLVLNKHRAQDVKKILEKLKEEGKEIYL